MKKKAHLNVAILSNSISVPSLHEISFEEQSQINKEIRTNTYSTSNSIVKKETWPRHNRNIEMWKAPIQEMVFVLI